MLTLYHHGSSVCAAKVRLSLVEKQLDWQGRYIDILAGEQFNPDYLAINPKAQVPTLDHDGTIITESTVICEYLEDVFPGHELRPAEPAARARMRQWTKLVDEEVHPSVRPLTYVSTHRHSIMQRSPEEVEAHINDDPHPVWRERKRAWIYRGFDAPDVKQAVLFFAQLLKNMEETLGVTPWLAGDDYSLADAALTPYLNRLEMLSLSHMWADHGKVADWFDRVKARASFEPALFQYLPEKLRQDMEANGRKAWPHVEKILLER